MLKKKIGTSISGGRQSNYFLVGRGDKADFLTHYDFFAKVFFFLLYR